MLAVCGGYQLLGRFYRDRYGSELPGAGVLPLHTVAGDRRMIGDVLLECTFDPAGARTLAGFENHAGRTILDEGAEPLGRVIAGFGNDGASGFEGCRLGPRRSAPTCTGRCCRGTPGSPTGCSPRRPPTGSGGEPPAFEPLADRLEAEAHAVSAARARSRGGRALR